MTFTLLVSQNELDGHFKSVTRLVSDNLLQEDGEERVVEEFVGHFPFDFATVLSAFALLRAEARGNRNGGSSMLTLSYIAVHSKHRMINK